MGDFHGISTPCTSGVHYTACILLVRTQSHGLKQLSEDGDLVMCPQGEGNWFG